MQTLRRARTDRDGLAQRFNPNHAPAGSPEGGQFTSDGDGGGGGSEKPSAGKPGGKGKVKVANVAEFNKKGIRLDHDTTINKAKQEKFLQRWNDKIGEAPEEFKNEFLGGLPGTMKIGYQDANDKLVIEGKLQDEDGNEIGEYDRRLNLKDNSAYSAWLVLNKSQTGSGVGKQLLAANVALYQKLGFDKVEVTANIDVGGYAWAKYGYVPTADSWRELSRDIRDKLANQSDRASHAASGSGYTPESWDQITDHDQSQIETAWMRSTHDEFYDSEVQNWRDSGQALDDAKYNLAEGETPQHADWAKAALERWRSGRDDEGAGVPFTNEQILAATSVSYDRDYEGRNDPEIEIDDDQLKDESQPSLPGLEAPPLSDETKQEITDALTKAFNDEAEENADRADPPSIDVSEYQGEYWDSMSDRDKFDWAERNSELPEYPLEEDEEAQAEPVETTDPQREALLKLARSSDPKALWAIADSTQGKQLLLDTRWSGVIDFKDKQTMERFHAYVSRKPRV